jgi:DNA modification methylase
MVGRILIGDATQRLREVPDGAARCCVTSPPYYGLRDYGVEGQIGLEESLEHYIDKLVEVFQQVRRVLADDGTVWLNIGDTYSSIGGTGHQGKHGDRNTRRHTQRKLLRSGPLGDKQLMGVPWRVALALQDDGWILRQDIIWAKPNPMPESVTDRCTKSHEYMFLLSKRPRYYFNHKAIQEPAVTAEEAKWAGYQHGLHSAQSYAGTGKSTRRFSGRSSGNKERKLRPSTDSLDRGAQAGSIPWEGTVMRNKRSVWTVASKPFKGAHFATYPPALIEPCILASSEMGDTVLDPFFGSGTTGLVAARVRRTFLGIELNPEYAEIARQRLGLLVRMGEVSG